MSQNQGYDIIKVLDALDPSALDYTQWLEVGMALKADGFSVEDWERWSMRDVSRYHRGECQKKWDGFHGSGVTSGTIVQYARDQGWMPDELHELEWDSVIGAHGADTRIVNMDWLEDREVAAMSDDGWEPAKQLIRYLELLFQAEENVGYVTTSYENKDNGRFLPSKGNYDRTAGELIQELNRLKDNDIGKVLGDYNQQAGAWIRFNPLDGNGVKNENVTSYRYALVESDSMPIERQRAIIQELELPVAVLVHSGGKSLHAIVRIDAASYDEYRKRVDYLYDVCKKNGLVIDTQNRNPSRLSRMPGVKRGDNYQYIVAENIGMPSYNEWKDWIEAANDSLPDVENLADTWDNLPPLAPPLINGVLRQGHKMLLAGPSKAGKSFALIELCIAIAEGRQWFGWQCAQGRVFYVNLELDPASCKHRFHDVYTALGWHPDNIHNIDVWDLRGKAVPMDQLAPKLIRRCIKRGYAAIVIDPIYKVLTGDENSAEQMAKFCNQFDRIAAELGCAVIYCHHHSKGGQGQKRSMDRASGSGVFARDPDAMLDMIELAVKDTITEGIVNTAVCEHLGNRLNSLVPDWLHKVSESSIQAADTMLANCKTLLPEYLYKAVCDEAQRLREQYTGRTAWRIEGTLREFKPFAPKSFWFDYPIHSFDHADMLQDAPFAGSDAAAYIENFGKRKTNEERAEDRLDTLIMAYEACHLDGIVTVEKLAEYTGKSPKSMVRWVDENAQNGFRREGKMVDYRPTK